MRPGGGLGRRRQPRVVVITAPILFRAHGYAAHVRDRPATKVVDRS